MSARLDRRQRRDRPLAARQRARARRPLAVAQLDRLGIEQALVHHSTAWLYDPALGNGRLLRRSRASRGFALLRARPARDGELGDPAELSGTLAAAGVRAVRVYPRDHGWTLAGAESELLFRTVAEAGLPVFVDLVQTDWRPFRARGTAARAPAGGLLGWLPGASGPAAPPRPPPQPRLRPLVLRRPPGRRGRRAQVRRRAAAVRDGHAGGRARGRRRVPRLGGSRRRRPRRDRLRRMPRGSSVWRRPRLPVRPAGRGHRRRGGAGHDARRAAAARARRVRRPRASRRLVRVLAAGAGRGPIVAQLDRCGVGAIAVSSLLGVGPDARPGNEEALAAAGKATAGSSSTRLRTPSPGPRRDARAPAGAARGRRAEDSSRHAHLPCRRPRVRLGLAARGTDGERRPLAHVRRHAVVRPAPLRRHRGAIPERPGDPRPCRRDAGRLPPLDRRLRPPSPARRRYLGLVHDGPLDSSPRRGDRPGTRSLRLGHAVHRRALRPRPGGRRRSRRRDPSTRARRQRESTARYPARAPCTRLFKEADVFLARIRTDKASSSPHASPPARSSGWTRSCRTHPTTRWLCWTSSRPPSSGSARSSCPSSRPPDEDERRVRAPGRPVREAGVRRAELRRARAGGEFTLPEAPIIFFKPATSLIGHNQTVICPDPLDEAGLRGRARRRDRQTRAARRRVAVGGRRRRLHDLQRRHRARPAAQRDRRQLSLGPEQGLRHVRPARAVPRHRDEIPDPQALDLEFRIGDTVLQRSTPAT